MNYDIDKWFRRAKFSNLNVGHSKVQYAFYNFNVSLVSLETLELETVKITNKW